MNKEYIIYKLSQFYPDKIIYRETWPHKPYNDLQRNDQRVYTYVDQLAESEKITVIKWLNNNGFVWRETGYCEPKMKSYGGEWKADSPRNLATSILRRYPLIGQYELSVEEYRLLFDAATSYIKKMCSEGKENFLTLPEKQVLTVTTVAILKKKTTNLPDDSTEDNFWKYIRKQFGVDSVDEKVWKRVYSRFCEAIKQTLEYYQYKRFIAPQESTMSYYTSMMIHAIAPRESIESLFEILLGFYIDENNLNYQYISEDISYKTLVNTIRARLTKNKADIHVKSSLIKSGISKLYQIRSGLQTLFLETPGYMSCLCDRLVKKLDALMRGENVEIQDRWDLLLTDWYNRISSEERNQQQEEKRNHKTDYVATSENEIYIKYAMEDGKVGLLVPRIRLPKTGEKAPVFVMYQGKNIVCRCDLSTTGDDLCKTTKKLFVPLEEQSINFAEEMCLRCEIEYMSDTLYSSGTQLYRKVICFDETGIEHNVKNGIVYLFADEKSVFGFADDSSVTQAPHAGQLYRINLNRVGTVYVDGTELFADDKHAETARLYPSILPVSGIKLCFEGNNYQIFKAPFSLKLYIPESDNQLRYQFKLDGQRLYSKKIENNVQTFQLPPLTGLCHTMCLVDVEKHFKPVLEEYFVYIPGFDFKLDKRYYLETDNTAELTIYDETGSHNLTVYRKPESALAISPSDPNGIIYNIELPTVSCSFGEQSAFCLPNYLWYKTVDKGIFSSLKLPNSLWQGQLMLGDHKISANYYGQYEIGNLLHSGKDRDDHESFWLSLQAPDGKKERIPFTDIYFRPSFTEIPVQFCDAGLMWQPCGCYVGDDNSLFKLVLSGPKVYSFQVQSDCNQLLCSSEDIKQGRYCCEVLLQKKNLLGVHSEQCIFKQENFIIGDENEFRFEGQELRLTKAFYCDEFNSEEPKPEYLTDNKDFLLVNPRFQQMSRPDEKEELMPEYQATLYYEDKNSGIRKPFKDKDNKNLDELSLTNPVTFWLRDKSKHTLILHTIEGLPIFFDTESKEIPYLDLEMQNKKLKRNFKKYADSRLQDPFYFEFETRKAYHV